MHPWLLALIGGTVIGGASALLMSSHGRICGISGIVGASIERANVASWRIAFIVGLALAGVLAIFIAPASVAGSPRSLLMVAIAGLLVGIGTRLGGGCTSGHGVCGLGRLSSRSLAAVMTFIATGAITVWIVGAR